VQRPQALAELVAQQLQRRHLLVRIQPARVHEQARRLVDGHQAFVEVQHGQGRIDHREAATKGRRIPTGSVEKPVDKQGTKWPSPRQHWRSTQ
jgi:hypothetical protein